MIKLLGQGRLKMKDGSYYEGSFVDGEMCGHGYRVFGHNGSTYTGTSLLGNAHRGLSEEVGLRYNIQSLIVYLYLVSSQCCYSGYEGMNIT